jgi:hypothetical protein
VDVFCLGRKLEINKLHVLSPTKAEILHEGLQEAFSARGSVGQWPGNDRVEHVGLLDTARDVKKLEKRVEIADVVDAETGY